MVSLGYLFFFPATKIQVENSEVSVGQDKTTRAVEGMGGGAGEGQWGSLSFREQRQLPAGLGFESAI